MSKTKHILIDLPNTLFDSRHRTIRKTDICMTGIKQDTLNYPCYTLLKSLVSSYKPIYTHYCLSRLQPMVEEKIKNLPEGILYCNFNTQSIYSNATLKKYIFENIDHNIEFVIDNDPQMQPYWLNAQVGLVQIPLGIQ